MRKIYLQTAKPVNGKKEDNGLNITSNWYEHDPKGYVLEKGRGGRDIVIFVSFIFV